MYNTINMKKYITTTLPYVNAEPHIEHALEFVLADTIVRYYRHKLGKENVFFNVGTDEHGQKIWEKAEQEGLEVHDFTDKYVNRFIEFCNLFDVSYDSFYRTSKQYHYPVAQGFWNAALEKGDIYKKLYKGKYCVGCERFKLDKELVNGLCPDHQKAPIDYEEENYFFKLSKYKDEILDYLQSSDFVIPESARNFAIEFCKNDLEDISISRNRAKLPWGIPIPDDDTQVMYVWFDALSNYIGAITYLGNTNSEFTIQRAQDRMNEWEMIQLCGDDNIRFQSIIWQGMLRSAGLPFSKKLLVHAWILGSDGRKMSKTLRNVVSPFEELNKYGKNAVRYFFLACMQTSGDAIYNSLEFKNKYNSALADNFGNIINRLVVLKEKLNISYDSTKINAEFIKNINLIIEAAHESMKEFNVFDYCARLNEIGNETNLFLTNNAPWNKDAINQDIVLNSVEKALRELAELYEPIVPEIAKTGHENITTNKKSVLVQKID